MNRLSARPLPLLTMTLLLATAAAGCHRVTGEPATNAQRADRLANGVALASGAAALPRVHTIAFTYAVREGDTVRLARTHVWDLKAGTDTVSIGDQSTTIDLKNVDQNDPAQADAFKAWTNDTYWLAAPLKLFNPGVTREYVGRRELAGKTYEVLGVSLPGDGGAPADRYNLYVDPYTSLVAYWDHMPNADTTELASWEQYRHPQNLVLATRHKTGSQTIDIENLAVSAD
jgi:hypothetical protein